MASKPDYVVIGHDGREYPADAAALAEWIHTGRVSSDQMVRIVADGRWIRIGELPPFPATATQRAKPSLRAALMLGVGCGAFFLLFVIVVVVGAMKQDNDEQKQRTAIKERQAQTLRQRAAAAAAEVRQHVANIEDGRRTRDLARVDREVAETNRLLRPYLQLEPLPPELVEPVRAYRAASAESERRTSLLAQYKSATDKEQAAHSLEQKKDWIGADRSLAEASSLLEKLDSEGTPMPSSFAPAEKRASIEKERRRIAPRVLGQKEDEAKQAALVAVCGEKPFCSSWDGECGNIESALKRVAHDPSSIDVENCTNPTLQRDRCWVTTCDVRGKNAYGALVLQRKTFSISKLGVEEIP